ncbi:hypothetical protein C7446_2318 [Kushneria sinocarnis]|uniref:Uncharacterized protein n=1 Tax=Kushneria sinocarnis TaxID=595502 RepID=A0A420WVK9_9GAMM|nr:hypothetical protein [Kushneria sinocarnis]RKR02600.1 hypothetical protein C7446_2318 [Kushneria sinocarnis]
MTGIPDSITAGTTLSLPITLTAYPADDWSLTLILRGAGSIDLSATPDGNTHRFAADASTTSEWPAGNYWYSLRASRGADVHEIDSGTLTVRPDIANRHEGYDGRVHAERVLEAIEAVIEGRATKDQDSYRINNRELRRTSIDQLLKLRHRYRLEVQQLRAKRKGRNTLGRPVLARFGRV